MLKGDVWHIGAISQTMLTGGFTTMGAPILLPDVKATGTVMVSASGNTTVNLVSLGRTRVRGLINSETSSPAFLTLVFAPTPAPEPGTLLLLGSGVVGLAAIGRRKLRQSRLERDRA